MRLRALTLDRNIFEFSLSDVPVAINDTMLILANRNNSPILIAQSVVRGSDDGELFETDFVLSDSRHGVLGFVVYSDGFYIWDSQENIMIPLRNTDGLKFIPNTQMHRLKEMGKYRSKIRFGSDYRRFGIDRIVYFKEDELYITIKPSGPPISISSLKFGTGVISGNRELLYGQVTETGKIVMKNYHPMLKLPGGKVRELEVSDYE